MGAFPEQRMSIITLGVSDLEEATTFYRDILGLKPFMRGEMTAFDMGGFALGLWDINKLHKDVAVMGNTCPKGACPNFALAYNARTEAEVDLIFDRLRAEDVEITVEPHKAFWGGYSGYFLDRDGYAWEVAYNPHWGFQEDGRLQLPATEEEAGA
ncbi:MAG: VOC family protein [Hyphomonadaceae bacterium]